MGHLCKVPYRGAFKVCFEKLASHLGPMPRYTNTNKQIKAYHQIKANLKTNKTISSEETPVIRQQPPTPTATPAFPQPKAPSSCQTSGLESCSGMPVALDLLLPRGAGSGLELVVVNQLKGHSTSNVLSLRPKVLAGEQSTPAPEVKNCSRWQRAKGDQANTPSSLPPGRCCRICTTLRAEALRPWYQLQLAQAHVYMYTCISRTPLSPVVGA